MAVFQGIKPLGKKPRYQRAFIFALSLQLALGLVTLSPAAYFQDIRGNWASNAIERLSEQNIIGGYPGGYFRPQGLITRAEIAAILQKAQHLPTTTPPSGQATFKDVPPNYWAYPAIETVQAQHLVSGYPSGYFRPNQYITRAEAVAILANLTRNGTIQNPSEVDRILSRYPDAGNVPAWAKGAVAGAIRSGVLATEPSRDGKLEANSDATRAEIAAMVNNVIQEQSGLAGNQPRYPNYPGGQGALQGRVSQVPANTVFTGTLTQPISSEMNRVGDNVTLTLDQALTSTDNQITIPAGARVNGQITAIQSAGRLQKPATIQIQFNELALPDGQRIPIQAVVATEDGQLHGGTTKGRIFRSLGTTAIGAGLGAALGTAMGPLSGGKAGKGAIYGTAIGGGAGAIAAAAMKGKAVIVSTGDRLEVKLQQPISVEAGQ